VTSAVPLLPASLSDWLRSVTGTLPPDLDEEACRSLVLPPPDSVFEPLDDVRRLIVHHSATADGSAALFRLLHRGVFGWSDVGYHFVIGNGTWSGDGRVEKGRPEWAAGAHARGGNHDSLGICLVGDFRGVRPSSRQKAALFRLLARLLQKYGLDRDAVILHRESRGCRTECPGDALAEIIEEYRLSARESSRRLRDT
jgi:hypothetical protein